MGFELTRPWALLLLPVMVAAVLLMDRFIGRRFVSLKRKIARVLRVLLASLLVLALSGPVLLLPGSRSATWALLDLSGSMTASSQQMQSALSDGLAAAPKDLQIGAIAFGQDAMVDAPLAQGRTQIDPGVSPGADATDIGRALALAQALLPQDAAGRIALLSDGQDTAGKVDAQLTALKARGIAVDVLPLAGDAGQDAQVTAVDPPAQAYQGERFNVTVRVDANYDTDATLVLYAGRTPVGTREVTLRRGENAFVFEDIARDAGVVTYEAQLIAPGDRNPSNDRLGAYIDVRGTPNILIVGDGQELKPMLESAGMQVTTLTPQQLPTSVEMMREYHAVALVNVNAGDVSDAAKDALDAFARQLGRGVAVFGGDDTYAIGGWRGDRLEEMLPVTMDVDNRLDMPTLSLILVIDKSGSMTDGWFGITRLDMAKEAAMRATEVLTAQDQIGVIAFDDTAKWVVPLQQVEDVSAIQSMIGTIRPGGGTAYYSSLAQSLQALMATDTQLRHVIFLTDGAPGDSGFEQVVQRMGQEEITLSTVAIGSGANVRLLERLAEWGGGRSYEAYEFEDIPKIFTKETYIATQAYVQNHTFTPVIFQPGPLTDYAGFPPVDGYLASTARPLATVALGTDRDEPLLAWWQYGAGRVLSWMSDTRGAWTESLLRWEDASQFFAGMIAHVLPAEAGEGEITATREDGQLRLVYRTGDGETDLKTEASIVMPDGESTQVALTPSAPGVYEGEAAAAQEGAYAVRVTQHDGETLVRTLESGVTVGYSTEHDLRREDGQQLLERIAMETGGRVLTGGAALFEARGEVVRGRREITTPLLICVLVLFLLDAAQRRLAWERLLPDVQARREAREKRQTKKREGPKPPKQAETEPQPQAPKPGDTAEKLLERRTKKLM